MIYSTQHLELGDSEGHAFHGNQWTGGKGGGEDGKAGETSKGLEGQANLRAAMARGLPRTDAPIEEDQILMSATEVGRGMAKAEIVAAAGADIAKAAESGPVRDEMNAFVMKTNGMPPTDERYNELFRGRLEQEWQDRQVGNWTDEELAAKSNEQLYGGIKAQDYVDTWAGSAADSDSTSLGLQRISAEILDAPSKSFDSYLVYVDDDYKTMPEMQLVARVDRKLTEEGATIKAFVQGEYDRTQAFLKDSGVSEVTLHRGFVTSTPYADEGNYPIDMNPASSWSVDRQTASDFASDIDSGSGYVLTMTVPASDIISTARTGQGALHEGEVIVRNQPGHQAFVSAASY